MNPESPCSQDDLKEGRTPRGHLSVQRGLDLPEEGQPALIVRRPPPPLQRLPLHLVPAPPGPSRAGCHHVHRGMPTRIRGACSNLAERVWLQKRGLSTPTRAIMRGASRDRGGAASRFVLGREQAENKSEAGQRFMHVASRSRNAHSAVSRIHHSPASDDRMQLIFECACLHSYRHARVRALAHAFHPPTHLHTHPPTHPPARPPASHHI
jgi:hypothetical protein